MRENFLSSKKIFSLKELNELGFSDYKVRKMVSNGNLEKLNKRTYENMHYDGEESDFIYVYAYVPDAIICLLSAAVYYGLTSYRPDSIEVAVKSKRKVSTLPQWPTIKLWYYDSQRLKIGLTEIISCGEKVKIFDIEKTVIDIIYYRKKIGMQETKEVLINYLSRSDRNINKLYRYAQQLNCKKILQTYLEVLL